MPGSQIFAPEVSRITRAPSRAPPGAELGFAVRDGDDLDALAAGVGQPGRDRYRADLGDLVQRHEQRRVEPPAGHPAAGQRGECSGSRWPGRRTAVRRGSPRRVSRRSGTASRPGAGSASMSSDWPGPGSTAAASAGSARNASARLIVIRIVWAVLFASPRSSASCAAHCGAGAVRLCGRMSSASVAAHPGDPPGDGAQVEAGEGGGVEVGAQVVAGLGGPERGVLDAVLADRLGERVGAADRGRPGPGSPRAGSTGTWRARLRRPAG